MGSLFKLRDIFHLQCSSGSSHDVYSTIHGHLCRSSTTHDCHGTTTNDACSSSREHGTNLHCNVSAHSAFRASCSTAADGRGTTANGASNADRGPTFHEHCHDGASKPHGVNPTGARSATYESLHWRPSLCNF